MAHRHQADIIAVNETKLTKKLSFANYALISRERKERGGSGVALLVKHGIQFHPTNWFGRMDIEALSIRVQPKDARAPPLDVVVYYNPPHT